MYRSAAAQESHQYLVIEFIKVSSNQMVDYSENKDFLEKIYEQAVKQGDIQGWDLWSLQSGPDQGGFQYVTITYYNDPVKMMNGMTDDNFLNYAERAYDGKMKESEIAEAVDKTKKNRDLAMRAYMTDRKSVV